jgi:hypothetical protein
MQYSMDAVLGPRHALHNAGAARHKAAEALRRLVGLPHLLQVTRCMPKALDCLPLLLAMLIAEVA